METEKKLSRISEEYAFYGHERAAGVHAAHRSVSDAAHANRCTGTAADTDRCPAALTAPVDPYPGIDTPLDLYDALSEIWCAATCAPRMRADWTPENRTLGQCSITAFLAQDIFGGEVRGIPQKDGGVHCYNVVDGVVFDLTSEQFGERAKELDYADNVSGKLGEESPGFVPERESPHQNPLPEQELPRPNILPERKSPRQNPLQERESAQHFGKAEKRARYEYLRNALRALQEREGSL